ncbi:homocysteine S-methyltransferase family protein [Aeromicrobium sp. NPDC092404]|uniref:homocysteine S-methyltransferase family protein n=1 Tax=Aeromicrobium sp. NPDC092404 TaxID=3154976 RepID=UPI003447C629
MSAMTALDAPLVLTDGGIETTLIFHDGIDLPDFAAFILLDDEAGREALRRYFVSYLEIARRDQVGIVLETPTWRAHPDGVARQGRPVSDVAAINRAAVDLLVGLRDEYATSATTVVVSGCIGPRGDGYAVEDAMDVAVARDYHAAQVAAFAESGVDLVTGITMTYVEEATGLVLAARDHGIPVVISFTVETDGRLPSGQDLGAAIEAVDTATDAYARYFMINCAHPTHVDQVLDPAASWAGRLAGLRANASMASHAELDEAEELDEGDPEDLGRRFHALRQRLPGLRVLGGCCGTDARHVAAISEACVTP